jgi:hypothetical protein
MLNQSYEPWYIYHATWAHLNGALCESFSSLIPTLQPFEFLRQNLNIAWTPIPIFMKLSKYIMPHEAIPTTYLINSSHQQYRHCSLSNLWEKTLILLSVSVCIPPIKCECLNQYLYKLIVISWHLTPTQILHCRCFPLNVFRFLCCPCRIKGK